MAGAGGTIRVANGCRIEGGRVVEPRVPRRFLPGVQVPEYLRAFLFGRLGWNRLGGNLIVSGAFGLFQRHYLLEIGGYTAGNVVEDLDLVIRLHAHLRARGQPYEIPFIPDRLLPKQDYPYPVAPQKWPFRRSIEYSITADMAILDVASKNREDFLYRRYLMGNHEFRWDKALAFADAIEDAELSRKLTLRR